eukprot:TRINITY_DN268_c0_g1_i2.p1 TRINITY_DN268_c0_g1~~TRINITY_DN268_c0_g1_i2.p1  ORF type:complete len:1096 (+),score=241.98 TRINITY_DN268_c0_g1_i2:155-3442(+)
MNTTPVQSNSEDRAELFDETKATGLMDLYSRQIGTFGVETMKNLTKLRVLIIGCKGVGVETAKNVILAGPAAVVIHDDNPVEIFDLGTNFNFSETTLGNKRSLASLDKLKELNPYVDVSAHSGDLSENFIKSFGAVVVTDHLPLEQLIYIDEICHKEKSVFLLALTNGVVATIFTDFGPEHAVNDPDGEPTRTNVIDDISVLKEEDGKPYLVVTVTAARHGLDEDTLIAISDVEGITELNKLPPFKVKRVYKTIKDNKGKSREVLVLNKIRIDHEDIPKWGQYKGQGMISEVKATKKIAYKPLKETLQSPLTETDMGFVKHPNEEKMYMGRGVQLHFARLALWEFDKHNNRLPKLHDKDDAEKLVEYARQIVDAHKEIESAIKNEKLDETLVRNVALYARTELCGITAFLGGVIAQEIIKKFGKYTPICQWIHLDYDELLSETVPADATPIGSRHDNQIAIFGKAFQEKLEKQSWFMVGCGALGCEYLKGFSLMGLGSNGGVLYVTDMDTIEVSNLSRQFLFRRDDVGLQKSKRATVAALRMNPKMNIVTFEIPVGPDTENKFNDRFWSSLDGVCNALDNIKAREYTDSKCVFYEKPLLESGTLGTKANSEMVVPHKTKSYAEHEAGGEEEAIPMCTLRNFPHLIEHCIEWARAQFTDVFETPAASYNKFIKNPKEFFVDIKKQKEGEALDVLENVTKIVKTIEKGPSFETCSNLAFSLFITQFRDRILNLIYAFPEDSMKEDKDTGAKVPFWCGAKRFPKAAEYDINDPFQFEFLYNCTNLYLTMFKLPVVRNREEFKKQIASLNLTAPKWEPDRKFLQKVQNEVKDQEAKSEGRETTPVVEETDEEKLTSLTKFLQEFDISRALPVDKADFEKDDDSNFHIDFITGCSNMRALNYTIPTATRHKCKMIAGKIIPAVATTTAMITGVVEMELYKFVLQLPVSKFCNSNINLAVSDFKLFEPIGPKKAKESFDPLENEVVVPVPDGWTIWDKIVIDKGDLTVGEFVEMFPQIHHGCTISSLFFKQPVDGTPIWLDFPITTQQKELVATNTSKKISQVYTERWGESDKAQIQLYGSIQTSDGKTASVPPIQFVFRK